MIVSSQQVSQQAVSSLLTGLMTLMCLLMIGSSQQAVMCLVTVYLHNSSLQSKSEEITVQEVGQQEDGEDEAEVDDCITEHITHISRALTTEGFRNTTDPLNIY